MAWRNLSKGQSADRILKLWKSCVYDYRPSNMQLLKFWLFNFSNLQTTFVKDFRKKNPGFKIYVGSTDKGLPIQQYLWSEISRQWNNSILIFFFLICTEERFASYILSNEGNIKALILLIVLKFIAVGCFNGTECFTGRLFLNYGPLNILFHFFWYLIFSVFHETFVKQLMKMLRFSISNFRNLSHDVVYYGKLGCLTLCYWNGGSLNIR